MGFPETFRIVPDGLAFGAVYHIEHAGRLADGRQFLAFALGAFPNGYKLGSDWRSQKRWLAILHLFNAAGEHQSTRAWSAGVTADGEREAVERARTKLAEWLAELKHYTLAPIAIRPFDVVVEGVRFGLIPNHHNETAAELLPNGLAFIAPWDGTYDT